MGRTELKKARRIVIKVGTSVLAKSTGYKLATGDVDALDKKWMEAFAEEAAELAKKGKEVIIVSSGAIACGMRMLGLNKRPIVLHEQQSCAAIGQSRLMNTYEEIFSKRHYHVAQILLTLDDMFDRRRYLNAKNTIDAILNKGVIPIINENDTVAVDEIKFGDNDKLSSLVANLMDADLLILLTDVDGFLGSDKKKISVITKIAPEIEKLAQGTKRESSLGGMVTKIEAAKIATNSGIPCVIANGREEKVLGRILEGEDVGTLFPANKDRMRARKRWIAYSMKTKGVLMVDDGAKEALLKKGKSLLACGIKGVHGKFSHNELISVVDADKKEFARGLSNYTSQELEKIKGRAHLEEVVHRDNLVIL